MEVVKQTAELWCRMTDTDDRQAKMSHDGGCV